MSVSNIFNVNILHINEEIEWDNKISIQVLIVAFIMYKYLNDNIWNGVWLYRAAFWLSKILVMYYFKYYKYAHNVYYNLFQFQLIILIHFKWPLLLPTVPLHSYVSLYNHLLIFILIIKRLQRNIKNKSSDTLKNRCGNYLVRNYYRDAFPHLLSQMLEAYFLWIIFKLLYFWMTCFITKLTYIIPQY